MKKIWTQISWQIVWSPRDPRHWLRNECLVREWHRTWRKYANCALCLLTISISDPTPYPYVEMAASYWQKVPIGFWVGNFLDLSRKLFDKFHAWFWTFWDVWDGLGYFGNFSEHLGVFWDLLGTFCDHLGILWKLYGNCMGTFANSIRQPSRHMQKGGGQGSRWAFSLAYTFFTL